MSGFDKVVRMLLYFGADVNLSGKKAIFWAANQGHYEMVEILLGAGADIDSREEFGRLQVSAFSTALYLDHKEVAHLLLDRGARLNYLPKGDLCRAVSRNQIAMVQLILERGAGIIPQETYNEALLHATRARGSKLTQMLLKAGADANAVDPMGKRMDELAYFSGDQDLVDVLLDADADPSLVINEERRLKIHESVSESEAQAATRQIDNICEQQAVGRSTNSFTRFILYRTVMYLPQFHPHRKIVCCNLVPSGDFASISVSPINE